MVPSDFTYVISVIGVIDVIGVIQFCKGPPFLFFILAAFSSRCEHMWLMWLVWLVWLMWLRDYAS